LQRLCCPEIAAEISTDNLTETGWCTWCRYFPFAVPQIFLKRFQPVYRFRWW
jgi:hypothetical protein